MEQSLRDYVGTNTLPSRVKVTQGIYDPQHVDWEFSRDDVLDLNKVTCPTVQLSFIHPDTGEQKSLSVSTRSPCLFKILPYIPGQAVELNRPMILNGLEQLIRVWPPVVCIQAEFTDDNNGLILKAGEKLRLKRTITRRNEFFLECSVHHSKLVLLPISSNMQFRLVDDTTAYMLSEITDMPAKVERRLRLSEDGINKTMVIPGLPGDYVGDLIMESPQRFVEIQPSDNPGVTFVVPLTLDLNVDMRDDDYYNPSFRWYKFSLFVDANSAKFPMIVAISNWEEEPVSVQAIRASVGERIILHNTEVVRKIACKHMEDHFIVPLTYDAPFEVQPRVFFSIQEVCTAKVKYVRVTRDATWRDPALASVVRHETLEIMYDQFTPGLVVVKKKSGQYNLSQSLRGHYEEIIHLRNGTRRGALSDIDLSSLPLTVTFYDRSISIHPRLDSIPRNKPIELLFAFSDTCVRASKNIEISLSTSIPVRNKIEVRYISQYKRESTAPDVSFLASCPEPVSEIEMNMLREDVTYEAIEDDMPPPLAPRMGRTPLTSTLPRVSSHLHTALPEPPSNPGNLPPRGSGVHRSESDPAPRRPPRAGTVTHVKKAPRGQPKRLPPGETNDCVITQELEYESVGTIQEYEAVIKQIFKHRERPDITISADANISSYNWQEMVVFLYLTSGTTSVPPDSLRMFAKDKINGAAFSKFSDRQLTKYCLNLPLIRHYREKSKNILGRIC